MNGHSKRRWHLYAGGFAIGLALGTSFSPYFWAWADMRRQAMTMPTEPVQDALCGAHIIAATEADDRKAMLTELRRAVTCIEIHRDTCTDSTQADFDARLNRLRDARDELRLRPEDLPAEEARTMLARIRSGLLKDDVPMICGTVAWGIEWSP